MSAELERITVHGKGSAETQFTGVRYAAAAKARGENGPEARTSVRPAIEALRVVVATFEKEGGLDVNRLQTNLEVQESTRYDAGGHRIFEGYVAVYTLTFTGTSVAAATKVHDALTSVKGATVSNLEFLIEGKTEAENAAFKAAVDDAERRFTAQCAALKLNRNDFMVAIWWQEDEHPRGGKSLALESDEAGAAVLVPGRAVIEVKARVSYKRKGEADR